MIVEKTDLDGYKSTKILCASHPKYLSIIVRLRVVDEYTLVSETVFEVRKIGGDAFEFNDINTAVDKYNEI